MNIHQYDPLDIHHRILLVHNQRDRAFARLVLVDAQQMVEQIVPLMLKHVIHLVENDDQMLVGAAQDGSHAVEHLAARQAAVRMTGVETGDYLVQDLRRRVVIAAVDVYVVYLALGP